MARKTATRRSRRGTRRASAVGSVAVVAAAYVSFLGAATPPRAEASVAAPAVVSSGKDCAYNSLSCVSGTETCVMCGRGADRTCKEDHTRCYWIGS